MKSLVRFVCLFVLPYLAYSQPVTLWKAYNDYRPGTNTHINATVYDLRVTDEGGPLRNIETGIDLPATVRVVVEGDVIPDDFGANSNVDPGSPADLLFNGFVEIGGAANPGLPGVRASAFTKLILVFENLDPTKRYNFRGTVARGGGYNDRWSVFGIAGADSYVAAHVDGSNNKNIFTLATFSTGTLGTNQVALNTGDNKAGSLVGWDNIEPGADGSFSIEAAQYVGPAPFGNPSAAAYGYGLNAIYLAEIQASGNLRITENPASQNRPAGATATFSVAATSPQPITYQWQKTMPPATNFVDIAGATQASYTTPVLTTGDHGTIFRARLTSEGIQTTSGEATLSVDGTIPTVTSVRGSINFNAVHVTFSEPMKLDMLAGATNYQLSGNLAITSATALDPRTARLLTSTQALGASYTLTVNNIEDIAGNKIAANSATSFNAFTITSNTVGLDLWKNIGGSTVQNLRDDLRYPLNPDVDYVMPTFDTFLLPALTNADNNTYGGRIRAWITPEQSGDYEFFIRADDQGELRISTDDKFDNFDNIDFVLNNLPDAADTTAGDPFQETGIDASVSLPITLVAGRKYALQAILKEGNGTDYLQIAWRRVGDTTPADQLQPIPGRLLSYYGPGTTSALPEITRIAVQAGKVNLEWKGTLQSSDDLITWRDETGLASPQLITPAGKKFYRAKN